ncbi:hypothetical protein ACWGDX_03040 [Streptomyces sp. NPDC055025]
MSTPPVPTPPAAGNPPPQVDPNVPPTPAAVPPGGQDPAKPPEGGDNPPLGPEGEKALAEWKKRAKDAEQQAKDQAARLKEFEDRDKTDAQKLTERATDAEERAATATRLAVAAKVEALAATTFEDPEDAIASLDPAKFIDDAGAINTDAIKTELAALLERKPHWAKAVGPRTPKPDPGQGARPGGTPGGIEEQIKEAHSKGDWRTVMRLQNSKLATPASPTK